jgi:tRNA modification GTPase
MASGTTFAAQSTPPGISGIAVLRLSGPASRSVLAGALGLENPRPRLATLATYRSLAGDALDDVLVTYFQGPHSYTGDDLAELSCHGNPLVVETILKDLFQRGCRPAEAGEFTRRAFANGKLDLCQAEAVAELIHARGGAALRLARRRLAGELGKRLESLEMALRDVLTSLEAQLEFSEDGENFLPPVENLRDAGDALARLAMAERHRPAVDGSLRLVLLGAPNAGKSSIFNALLGRDRAIVSPIAGTTRDFLEGEISLGPWRAILVDTAGLAGGGGDLERLAMERSRDQAAGADLLLWVLDASRPDAPGPPEELYRRQGVIIWNKLDLPLRAADGGVPVNWPALRLSAAAADGGALAREFLSGALRHWGLLPEDEELTGTLRQGELLREAAGAVAAALDLWEERTLELAAAELHRALRAIGRVTGRDVDGTVLDHLFSRFCIGK